MCKKLIYLVSFVLFLCLVRTSAAEDVDPSLVGWWKFDEGFGEVALDHAPRSMHFHGLSVVN